jgi:hypothetical protein
MRTLIIFIVFSLLLAGCEAMPGNQRQPTFTPDLPTANTPAATQAGMPAVPSEQGWRLIPQALDASLPGINFSMKVTTPAILGDDPMQVAAFNNAVQGRVEEWLKAYSPELLGTPEADPGWYVDVNYQVTSAADWVLAMPFAISSKMMTEQPASVVLFNGGHELLSILFEDEAYLGGAHPGTFYSSLTYDATGGQTLTLADLFEPGADYLGLLSALSTTELQKRPGLTAEAIAQGASPQAENYTVWEVTPQGLLIVFQEYQVGPYAAGAQSVIIPYEVLAEQLDPAGPLGSFAR